MPKTGSAVCTYCGFTQAGSFPDHERVGYNYQFVFDRPSNDRFDSHVANELLSHHLDTRKYDEVDPNRIRSTGHKRYMVELEDGTKGELTATPYGIVYKEIGKERQY